MFWLFKKRDDKLNDVHNKLHNSFSNLKKDMEGIGEWINHFKDKHNYHDKNNTDIYKEIEVIKEDVKYLKNLFISQHSQKEEPKTNIEEETIPISKEKILESLTLTQIELLKALARIQQEHNLKLVSLKDIKEEYYPEKSYSEVRTTISQYLDILLELGLVTKKRKGRQIYTSLTEKATQLFPTYKKEIEAKKKIKKK
ncbi:MAG: hypothetical protein KJ674_02840 [Nanoarchaeota archaeon]|nr:hypothetical protein [Nanoarchaeota archaeon]